MKKPIKRFGLTKTPVDSRDIQFGSVFQLPDIKDLPKEFILKTLGLKNQGATDYCTGYASTLASELQEDVELLPEYTFAKTKQIEGGDPNEWGANIRDAMKSHQKFGALEVKDFRNDTVSRDGTKWAKYDELASKHKKLSYFSVSGNSDVFDNIRLTLFANREEERAIVTGVLWKNWNTGVIPKTDSKGEFGHCIAVIGWKEIDGEPYLIVQNSYGSSFGDGGLNYFPREVVNRDFTYGAFTFKDIPVETARYVAQSPYCYEDLFFTKLYLKFREIFA